MPGIKPVNMAVFLSGGGTTLQNFIDKINSGELPARVSVVLSSKEDAYGLVRARENGIPTVVVSSRKYGKDWQSMSKAINEAAAKSQKLAVKQLKGLTGGLKIPGLT